MSTRGSLPPPEHTPNTQPATAGGPPQPPPKPPKLTARGLLDPGGPGQRLFVPDPVRVRDLARLLGVKPYQVVAELLKMRLFKGFDAWLDFSTAASIGSKHGFVVTRLV